MLNLNDYKNIHCIGIGGVGLSAVAHILLARGHHVTGSDMKESELTDHLIEQGARIFLGHRAKNVEGADLVVYSSAVSMDNPEMAMAAELGIPMEPRAEILGILMEQYREGIAISGTHGKTTTTSMIAMILTNAEKDPTILVGGNLREIGGNVRVGSGDYFVTEACEYMDSFLHLRPRTEIILNIESDHLDYFKDIEHIVSSFRSFTQNVPPGGRILAYDGNPFVKAAIEGADNIITFGFSDGSVYHVSEIAFNSEGMPGFNVCKKGEKLCHIQLNIPGEHNIINALAAFACCYEEGVDKDVIARTLSEYNGTQRRFDVKGITKANVKIVDDYAHHPTEIKATLSAAVNIPHKRLWCIFQPHTYTRTLALFDQFADAFERADVVVLADIYAAREPDVYNISSGMVADEIRRKYPTKGIYYFPTFDEIADFVMENTSDGDVVMTMGAGDIYKVGELILEKDWE